MQTWQRPNLMTLIVDTFLARFAKYNPFWSTLHHDSVYASRDVGQVPSLAEADVVFRWSSIRNSLAIELGQRADPPALMNVSYFSFRLSHCVFAELDWNRQPAPAGAST